MSKLNRKLNAPQTKIKASKKVIVSMAAMALLLTSLGGFFYAPKPVAASTYVYSTAAAQDYLEVRMHYLVNLERARLGRVKLYHQSQLRYSADIRANEEAKTNFAIDHTRPNGTSYSTVYRQVGYTGMTAWGENLAWGYQGAPAYTQANLNVLAAKIYNQWRYSPGHYANMINGRYNQTGIGMRLINQNGRMYYFATQEFARRSW